LDSVKKGENAAPASLPDTKVSVRKIFGIDSDMECPAFSVAGEHVPELDPDYLFDRDTTLAILAGFARNRRVMVTGYHGTGKSTHIEQVAARLNWPCVRVNLDSHVSRIDLVGKDAIVLKDGKQVTEFRDGILPWALQNNIALCFDEYDAGRPDVMFVIQRVLEVLRPPDFARPEPGHQARIRPSAFRLFATANTVGLGDTSGLYHGTQQINQAPDGPLERLRLPPHRHRRSTICRMTRKLDIVQAKAAEVLQRARKAAIVINKMVRVADVRERRDPQRLHQRRPVDGDEPAHGHHLGGERRPNLLKSTSAFAFRLTFLNKCDELERTHRWPNSTSAASARNCPKAR
jgi:cobaltochelatase CobS